MKYLLFKYSGSSNIGDEIQSLAAKRFLPRVDGFVDRDGQQRYETKDACKLIANAWYMHSFDAWPLDANIDVLFTSVHIDPSARDFFKSERMVSYLKAQGPIGTRDIGTKKFLLSIGVDAYFSGCLTLTLPRVNATRSSSILLVDCPGRFEQNFPDALRKDITVLTHQYSAFDAYSKRIGARMGLEVEPILLKKANSLIKRYSEARFVITTRLHCAMPCLAMGTPVLLLRPRDDDPRYEGLLELLWTEKKEDFASVMSHRGWKFPTENFSDISSIRNPLIEAVANFLNADLKPAP